MNREDVKDKEDYITYLLLELNNKINPIDFGKFFMEIAPTSGIENFKSLLEELYENKLVTKFSEPNGFALGNPSLVTLDLRYGISLKGIEYLKDKNLIKNKIIMVEKDVFVTYSWESEEHNDKVLSFTDFLRSQGFSAENDKFHSQNETATDFNKMMHQAFTDYKKVIIVLSKGYIEKATKFKGGVGNEYSMIIKDIETSVNKYILVAFEQISDDIIPLFLKGRQIIDLTNNANLNELYAKLKDEKIYNFSDIGIEKPIVTKKEIRKFEIQVKNIEIRNLNFSFGGSSQSNHLFDRFQYELTLELVNETNEIFSDYNVEVYYPLKSTEYDVEGRIDGQYKVVVYENNSKLFPNQTKSIKVENIILRHFTVKSILNEKIIIKIYSKNGLVEKEFDLNTALFVEKNSQKQNLTVEMFQDENSR